MKAKDIIDKINFKYIPYVLGTAVLCVTAVCSISYASSSKTGTAIANAYEAIDSNLVYKGVYLENVNIGGLTKKQAIERGNREYAQKRLDRTFTLALGNYEKDVTYNDLGGSYNIKKAVNEAYAVNRKGSKEERIVKSNDLENRREFIVPDFNIDKATLKSTINKICDEAEEMENAKGTVDREQLIKNLEKNMLINEKDILIYMPTKAE